MGSSRPANAQPTSEETAAGDDFRSRLQECLGGPWPEPCDLQPRVEREEQRDGFRLQWVDYAVEPEDRVPAILLIPDGVSSSSPALLPEFCAGNSPAWRYARHRRLDRTAGAAFELW